MTLEVSTAVTLGGGEGGGDESHKDSGGGEPGTRVSTVGEHA